MNLPNAGNSRTGQPSPLANFKPFFAQYVPALVAYIGSLAWYQSTHSAQAQTVAIVLAAYILVVTGWYGLIRREIPLIVGRLPRVAYGWSAVFEFVTSVALIAATLYKFVF